MGSIQRIPKPWVNHSQRQSVNRSSLHSVPTADVIRRAVRSEKHREVRLETIRPPSSGSMGSRLNSPCARAHRLTRGNRRQSRSSSRLPMGPPAAQIRDFTGDRGVVSSSAPPSRIRKVLTCPPQTATQRTWHSS